jgi:hypothetical protein
LLSAAESLAVPILSFMSQEEFDKAPRDLSARSLLILSPTDSPDFADSALDLLLDQESGVWHLGCGMGDGWQKPTIARAIGYHARQIKKAYSWEEEERTPC